MSNLKYAGCPFDDVPAHQCDGCDVVFTLTWNRDPVYDRPEFCPFCGDEIESIEECEAE